MIKSRLFVEFDAIFDTRAATIYSYGEQAVLDNINEKYFIRIIDRFKNIDYDDFKNRYAARDKRAIFNSVTTPVLYMVSDFVESTIVNSINSPDKMIPEIIINTYPYVLSEEEIKLIQETLVNYTKGYAEIVFVHMAISEITPMYVRDNLSILILYDYPVWLETHSATGDLNKITAPSTTLIGPEIFYIDPDPSIVRMADSSKINIFRAMEDYTSPFINLKLLPIYIFSMAIKYEGVKPNKSP